MASIRKTAFARTPRGPNPTGRKVPSLRIDKQFIDSFSQATLGAELSTVLTKTDSCLNIEVQANGRSNNVLRNNDRVIADSADISKINSLGTFINDERKAVLKTTVAGKAQRIFAAMLIKSRAPESEAFVPRPITKLSQGFVDIYRAVRASMEMMSSNLSLIQGLPAAGEANVIVRNHLIETTQRAYAAVAKFLLYRAGYADEDAPQKLNDFLTKENVLAWVYTRLSSQKLQLGGQDFEYRKVYFPKDPTKGITMLFSELVNPVVSENQLGVLAGMKGTASFLKPKFLAEFINVKEEDIVNFGPDSPTKDLKNVPIMVVPFPGAVLSEEIFAALARSLDRGLPWNSGNAFTPRDTLKFMGTIPKRLFYAAVQNPSMKAGLFSRMFPGFVYNRASEVSRGVYVQLMAYSQTPSFNGEWFSSITGPRREPAKCEVLKEVATAILQCSEPELLALIDSASKESDIGFTSCIASPAWNFWAEVDILATGMSDVKAADVLNGVLETKLVSSKKAKDNDGIRSARSQLTPASGALIRALKSKGYIALSDRIESWLRSFLTPVVQTAVAETIHAKLDASLAHPVNYSEEDRSAFIDADLFHEDDNDPHDTTLGGRPPRNPDE